MALIYALLVLGVSAGAAFVAWFVICRISRKKLPRVTWRIASRAVWLLPLYLFLFAKSTWAVTVAVLFTLGVISCPRQKSPALIATAAGIIVRMESLLMHLSWSGNRSRASRHRSQTPRCGDCRRRICNIDHRLANATRNGRSGHASRGLITIFLAIVFSSGALVRRVGIAPGDGYLGSPGRIP